MRVPSKKVLSHFTKLLGPSLGTLWPFATLTGSPLVLGGGVWKRNCSPPAHRGPRCILEAAVREHKDFAILILAAYSLWVLSHGFQKDGVFS